MRRKKLVGLVTGALILLALGAAACSSGTPNKTASDDVKRSIKVYESPT